jgi:hypothetical protein
MISFTNRKILNSQFLLKKDIEGTSNSTPMMIKHYNGKILVIDPPKNPIRINSIYFAQLNYQIA